MSQGPGNLIEAQLRMLIMAGLAGNEAAYRLLLRVVAERLRGYFQRRLTGRDADVEDLVQETLIAIHHKRATYNPALPFTAWLHAIARYRLIDFFRREGRKALVPLDDAADLTVDADAESALAAIDVKALLATLPPKQASAIRLTKIDGHSVQEAAQLSGQSESSIKVNVHRGLGRLMAAVKGGK